MGNPEFPMPLATAEKNSSDRPLLHPETPAAIEAAEAGSGRPDTSRDEEKVLQVAKLGGASFGTAQVTAAAAAFLAHNRGAGRAEVMQHLAAIAKYHGPERRRPDPRSS